MYLRFVTLLLAGLVFAAAPARAQVCNFSMTNIDFGNVSLVSGAAVTTTGTLTANCTGQRGRRIRICANFNGGSGGVAASGVPRYMLQGSTPLNYNLFRSSGSTQVWGSYTWAQPQRPPNITVNLGSNGSGTRSRTVYGRIYPNQTTAPTGTFVSTFSGSNTQIDYGYSTSFSCSSSLSPRVQNVPFTVRLTNNASCTVNTTALNFGTQFNLSADRDATNTVTVNCTAGTAYTVGLSNGTGGGTGPTARRMTNSSTASYVTYGIFRDAARTQPWGDVSGTNTAAGTGDGTNQAFTGYGRVPPQVEPPTLTYTDTVVVTVTY